MKLAIRELLMEHYLETNEYITQKRLAEEMLNAGLFTNIHSAQNMIQYNNNGLAKSIDFAMAEFLCKRFKKTLNEIII